MTMREYMTISCPPDLLPQITRELLSFAVDPRSVEVTHGPDGQLIHVHPAVAEAWFLSRNPEPVPAPAPEPVPPAPEPEPKPKPAAVPASKAAPTKTTSA